MVDRVGIIVHLKSIGMRQMDGRGWSGSAPEYAVYNILSVINRRCEVIELIIPELVHSAPLEFGVYHSLYLCT